MLRQLGRVIPIFIIVLFYFLHNIQVGTGQGSTALATLANTMTAGTWAELPTTNIDGTLRSSASQMNLVYTDDMTYDPNSKQLFVVGGDHCVLSQFMSYREVTNTWQILPHPPAWPSSTDYCNGVMHGYDHSAIDQVNGIFYHRVWNSRQVQRYQIATQTWLQPTVSLPSSSLTQCCEALEYFPELGGVVWVTSGSVVLYENNQWTTLAGGLALTGTYFFAEYNPVYKVMVFWSSGGNRMYKLDQNRQVTQIQNPSASLYSGTGYVGVLTVDPVTGTYLQLTPDSRQFYSYNVPTNTWSALSSPTKPSMPSSGVVATPIAAYGVNAFAVCGGTTNCHLYLYKYAAGSGGGGPVDTTPPTVSITGPSSGATVSSTVTVTATAADNIAVTGVQFLLDGQNLGQEVLTPPYSVSWNTTSATNGAHTLTARARDAVFNQTTSSGISVTVSNTSTSLPSSDFTSRCAAAGVLKCVSFDQASDIAGTYGNNSGILSGASTPQLDSSIKSSGNSSLKFTIPSNSGADTSGSYFTNFSNDFSTQFGENSDFYIQWRQRFSPEFLSTLYQGGGGWKQSIIGTGDAPGCSSSSQTNCASSCTALTIVTQNVNNRSFAQMYNSCTGSTSHGAYYPFETPFNGDIKFQNARPAPYCLYSQGSTGYFPPIGNCFGYFPNEWMTFQIRVRTGPRVNDEFVNSFVELWIGREGQASQQAYNFGPVNLTAGPLSEGQRFGKIWLLPYNTGKSSAQATPTAYTWYDELIISTNRIADPVGGGGGTPPGDTTPPSVSGITANSITDSGVTINWTTDEGSDTQVEYGTTNSYGNQTVLNSSLVTSHSQALSGLVPGTLYHYRVKSRDAAGNLATSADATFTTTGSQPAPPPGSLVGYWKLDEGSGMVASDSSGNSLSGTLANSAGWTAGKYGNAIRLNGLTDYVNLGNPTALRLTGSMTVSAWINASSFAPDDTAIVSKRDVGAYGFQLDATTDLGPRNVSFSVANGQGNRVFRYSSTTLGTNTWYHVAGVYDAASQTVNVYVNGQLVNGTLVGTVTSTQQDSAMNVNIGRRPGAAGSEFAGSVDDVRIYSRALTQAEIQASMAAPAAGGDTTPPTVSVSSPTGGSVSGTVTVSAAASDDIGVAGVQFQLDGNSLGAEDTTAPYTVSWNTISTLNGSHSLRAIARDAAGNATTSTAVSVTVNNASSDTSVPSVSVIGPSSGATVSATVTVSATASDNVGVVGVQFQIDGNYLDVEDTTAPYSVSWNTAQTTNGIHALSAVARDAAGNQTTSAPVIVTVNNSGTSPGPGPAPGPGPGTPTGDFSVPQNGLQAFSTVGSDSAIQISHARLEASGGSVLPQGVAIFGYRVGGVLVSEAGVPSTPLVMSGRIFAEVAGPTRTGVAFSNPSDTDADVTFYFSDTAGRLINTGSFFLPARKQIAAFLNEAPFNGGNSIAGTFTFTASNPIAAVALRGYTNERSEFLITTLPIGSLDNPPGDPVTLPHFADGGGWKTSIVLSNVSALPATGTVQFFGPGSDSENAAPVSLSMNGLIATTFNYTIPPGGVVRLITDNQGVTRSGSVRISPTSGTATPSSFAIFSFQKDGITVSEAGVAAAPAGVSFRIYAESVQTVQTGIALANTTPHAAVISVEALDSNGTSVGTPRIISIPAFGQIAKFANELYPSLPSPFRGILRLTSTSPVTIVGLRGRYNERNEFLITTTPTSNDGLIPTGNSIQFPHIVSGGGYTTQLILLTGEANRTSVGRMYMMSRDGQSLASTAIQVQVAP